MYSASGLAGVRRQPPRRPARRAPPAGRPSNDVQASKAAAAAARRKAAARPAAPVYRNPFPAGTVGGRTDQGVDYTGRPGSTILAPGAGQITIATQQSGWPGGGFVAERLSQGPAKGQIVYFAEDVQPKGVRVGTNVRAGQPIAAFNQGGWIEAGWGATRGGDAAAAQQAGQSSGYVPVGAGAYSTGFGKAFGTWIRKLRGPAPGSVYSNVVGGAPPWASNPGSASTAAATAPPAAAPVTGGRGGSAAVPVVRGGAPVQGPGGPDKAHRPRIPAPRRNVTARPSRTSGPAFITPVPTAAAPTSSSPSSPPGPLASLLSGSSSTAPGTAVPAAPASGRYDWLLVLGLIAVLGFWAWKEYRK